MSERLEPGEFTVKATIGDEEVTLVLYERKETSIAAEDLEDVGHKSTEGSESINVKYGVSRVIRSSEG
ncbi:hypothetical protein A2715_00240 [Candidatus Woesebacteria bacterium RIFCSPHIGHO2_01_FULL_39_32]|uniref:Uncharacterized protein n=2 Tax=Candidatus Woeseibacteriota TaxID=1752722 RepID=A0A0G0S798_9BACT|nr:MAG: hypothetical protein UT61_C0004G0027 [Candidatus Woesebacteria bacterium GW2011_GWA1_39_8]OGM03789.1 MAG: hypothetical protein A2124_00360 [Candidatus Woesebacteria bacterium GWB1_37_5]OGM24254.1 MAG: hypothetical protein A2715_00240 [Candidatus Woesebacteria bacterium RIFCSPHIGHO2_01_FULL_39_32]OGM35381.1 MAG: hypothetical protein A3F01_04595 [Candidatus Woesebacteria bacterium RIFCSPHIGHO2_12_FULL_38_11]OGM65325.1 MAG: hypothetical protein A2893_01195 [Candidatus Woesebacteria bacteri